MGEAKGAPRKRGGAVVGLCNEVGGKKARCSEGKGRRTFVLLDYGAVERELGGEGKVGRKKGGEG